MDLTNFLFFKNTPLIDFQNTIHFDSNEERDNFFLNGNHYSTLNTSGLRFNFVRDRSTISVPIPYNDFRGVNYCTFLSEMEPNTRYYAYVISYEYINDNVTKVNLLIDAIMTFTQGNVLDGLTGLKVMRRHMDKEEYEERLWELKNNDDVIKTSTKSYFLQSEFIFFDFDIIIQASCDLSKDFGTVDDPKIETSEGLTFDEITSPVNLYHVKQGDFQTLMAILAPYPWITQNFRSIVLIPSNFINDNDLVTVSMKGNNFTRLSKFRDKGSSLRQVLERDISHLNESMQGLYRQFGLKEEERHILRNEYTTTEVYTWDGQSLILDNGLLNEETGLEFKSLLVTGFHNEVAVYPNNYKVRNLIGTQREGSFLNDAIYFRNFDDVPILIDNYNLSLSKSANQRRLTEEKLVTNRIGNVFNKDANLKDRFYDAAGLLTNFSPMNFFGKFTDEHDFYRQQQAEHKDLALTSPTITEQNTNNALKRSEKFYAITLKHARPSPAEMQEIKQYYKLFGFSVAEENSRVKAKTQTVCDYFQFSGSWSIPNVDVSLIEMMKAQFENGVRFWHNNNSANPMTRNVMNNKWRITT